MTKKTPKPDPSSHQAMPAEMTTRAQSREARQRASRALQTFTLFPRLPIEIRFKIWRLSQPHDRVVTIVNKSNDEHPGPNHQQYLVAAQQVIPVQLQVCRESRQEALKWYSSILGTFPEQPVYFDFERDILFMYTSREWKAPTVGCDTLNALVKFLSGTEASHLKLKELYQRVRYLVVSGTEYTVEGIEEMQAFEMLDRLVLPHRRRGSGRGIGDMDFFNGMIAKGLAWKWMIMEKRKALLEKGQDESEDVRRILDKSPAQYYLTSYDLLKDLVAKDVYPTEVYFMLGKCMEAHFGGKSIV